MKSPHRAGYGWGSRVWPKFICGVALNLVAAYHVTPIVISQPEISMSSWGVLAATMIHTIPTTSITIEPSACSFRRSLGCWNVDDCSTTLSAVAFAVMMGAPQLGQVAALEDISLLQSGQLISGIEHASREYYFSKLSVLVLRQYEATANFERGLLVIHGIVNRLAK